MTLTFHLLRKEYDICQPSRANRKSSLRYITSAWRRNSDRWLLPKPTKVLHQWLISLCLWRSRCLHIICSEVIPIKMTSRSSTPSEGEIVESDSDKATTTLHKVNGTSVNPLSRSRVSVSQSPSPVPSPKRYKSRSKSRSPYREPRGSKRHVDDDHYHDRSRDDPRHFTVRYEERGYKDRRWPDKSWDLDRARGPEPRLSYDDRSKKPRDKRPKIRSRSPTYSRPGRSDQGGRNGTDRGGRYDGYRESQGRNGYGDGRNRPSLEQSVSDRGRSPVAAAYRWQKAETKPDQKSHSDIGKTNGSKAAAKYVPHLFGFHYTNHLLDRTSQRTDDHSQDVHQVVENPPTDEATLIEERRKKREAIKAKHRGQATPLLVQALALDNKSAPNSPKPESSDDKSLAPGETPSSKYNSILTFP